MDLQEFMESDAFKNQKKLIEERSSTLKNGHKVVHLTYVGELDNNDLLEIESDLNKVGLELSSFNKSGIIYNKAEFSEIITSFSIAYPLLSEIIVGVSSNIVWETLKNVSMNLWKKVNDKKVENTTKKKKMAFGIHASLNEHTSFDFELKGDMSEEVVSESLDKILDFLKQQKNHEHYHIPDYAYYDEKKKEWIKINVMEEMRKKA